MLNTQFDGYKLLEIREMLRQSQDDFARKIGYSREVVNKVEKGRMKPSKWFVEAVQKYVSEHQMPDYSQDVNILGKASHSSAKKANIHYLTSRLEQKNEATQFLVPMVGIKAQAGYVKSYEQVDYVETLEKYPLPPGVNPIGAIWRYFEIDGDSMEPTFSEADVVLATMVPVEDWSEIKDFCVYIIHTAEQLLIKRIYKKSDTEWILISDNEEMNPQVVLNVEDVKQLWLFRRQIRSKAPQPKEFKITA
jgi:phage repressor protein C with HTH and peptisase S24 domain